MIANNYIKYPEALRFQCEMFSNGYKNSPRIMRLMTVIFDWKVETPQWLKDAQARAKALVKVWKKAMITFNFTTPKTITKMITGYYYGPNGETWTGRGLAPKWISQLITEGHSKISFLYQSETNQVGAG